MSEKQLYVRVTTPAPPGSGLWRTPGVTTYRADDWMRLPDGTLVVILGTREIGTHAPGQWASAHKFSASSMEEAMAK